MIEQAAGRGDQHINATVDQQVLLLERDPPDQQRFGQARVLCVDVEILGNLGRQFAGGGQHEAARHPRPRAAFA